MSPGQPVTQPPPPDEHLTVRIDPAHARALREQSRRTGLSLRTLVREAIEMFLEEVRRRG